MRPHYEAQANALQADITLIMRANPYDNKQLDDSPAEIDRQIMEMFNNRIPAEPIAEEDFRACAGKQYLPFVDAVNNAMEERDVHLTMLAVCLIPPSFHNMYLMCPYA